MSAEFYPTTLNNHGRGCQLSELPQAAVEDDATQKAEAHAVQVYCNADGGHPAWSSLIRRRIGENIEFTRLSRDYFPAARACARMILLDQCPLFTTENLENGVLGVMYKDADVPRNLSLVEEH